MDPLSDVLSLLKPTTYGFRGLDAGGEWSLAYQADPGIKCYAIHSGECWLCLDGKPPIRLQTGDFILIPGGPAYQLCSAPSVPSIDAVKFLADVPPGTTATLNEGGACSGVGGYFAFEGRHAELLLGLLPPLIHIDGIVTKSALEGLIARTMRELRQPLPGGALLAEHLTQSLLIEALRLLLLAGGKGQTGWLFALADDRLRAALTAMHARPGQRWTLDSLAEVAAMSRSGFAAKFHATVGEPPMEYLTRWRMMLAAEKLVRDRAPVASIAIALGYESQSAFGAAFKRVIGIPPRQFAKAAAKIL